MILVFSEFYDVDDLIMMNNHDQSFSKGSCEVVFMNVDYIWRSNLNLISFEHPLMQPWFSNKNETYFNNDSLIIYLSVEPLL